MYNGVAIGRDGMRQFSTALRTAFPDLRITVEEIVAEGDLVATHITWGGTHLAEFQSPSVGRLAPTGKSFTAKAMDLYRIHDCQIGKIRDSVDRLTLLRQLGALPAPQLTTE
jgi:predicted ester cyclase